MTGSGLDSDKKLAALAAIEEVAAGMLVGLGTGTTAAHVIALLGERARAGLDVRAVATSIATEVRAGEAGIAIVDFATVAQVDLTIDGADEIDPRFRAIKGGGGAMVREKIVAAASRRMVVVADGTKQVARLGGVPVPVEVLPFALTAVIASFADADVTVRRQDGRLFASDNGNPILDVRWRELPGDIAALAARIDAIPGVVGHGLFVGEVDAAYIASNGVVTRLERSA